MRRSALLLLPLGLLLVLMAWYLAEWPAGLCASFYRGGLVGAESSWTWPMPCRGRP
ncbi:hypothetical protein [Marinobacter xestospongiae]|uniref:Uncharacterized protein n=1 Tax=Marinobacter xestospongiae TaxID=994319 RepID=A0ABU3VUN7_9GAMM|nr:hypothetical protein [Marinobacter xestospongiae]MDV2077984.1 hypothetical protein [Marinobacter xestospongiae]